MSVACLAWGGKCALSSRLRTTAIDKLVAPSLLPTDRPERPLILIGDCNNTVPLFTTNMLNESDLCLPPADRPERPLVLIGDCNNTVPSHKRGGGGVVVQHPHLWELLRLMAREYGTP